MKHKSLLILFFLLFGSMVAWAQDIQPNREFRGAWVTTVWKSDWPQKEGEQAQKEELVELFDNLKETHINVIFFQIRTECDALYVSSKEPWSRWITGVQGQDPGYDPLGFAIEEAHKRGMELHAWLNPFRVTAPTDADASTYTNDHVLHTKPEWILHFPNKILNPGIPAVREYVRDIVEEVVQNYDVDGIHFDDYFYPYSKIQNEDHHTYAEYGNGFDNIDDWRRNNINETMQLVKDVVRQNIPAARFGIGPFGIWKSGVPEGIVGTSAYDVLYADGVHWLENHIVDYLSPQLYWPIGGPQDFKKLLIWWSEQAFNNDRHLYVGHTLDKITGSGVAMQGGDLRSIAIAENSYDPNFIPNKKENSNAKLLVQSAKEVPNQVALVRENRGTNVLGSVFYKAGFLKSNPFGVTDNLKESAYIYPAIPPLMDWLPEDTPAAPINLTAQIDESTGDYVISWERSPDNTHEFKRYVLHNLPSPPVSGETPEGTVRALTANEEVVIPISELPFGTSYWAVTELSPTNYESDWSNYVTWGNSDMPMVTLPVEVESTTENRFIRFEWEALPGSLFYHYQLALDEDFTTIFDESETWSGTSTAKLFNNLQPNTYYFRIRSQNELAWSQWSSTYKVTVGSTVTGIANSNMLSSVQVYPNPSKGNVFVNVSVKKSTDISIDLLSVDGRNKTALVHERYSAGEHTITLDREKIAAGMYFLVLQSDDYNTVQKIILY